jgi:ketosteroid isomerase-like protein
MSTAQQDAPSAPARTAASAAAVVTEFFDRYRTHDINGMADLCSINASLSYVPLEVWGKQRVVRGDGKVGTIGKPLWTGLVTAFPDLTNTVHTVTANDDGDVVAEVDIEGTQQLAWGLIRPAGQHYCEPHLFVFHVGPAHRQHDRLLERRRHQPAAWPRGSRLTKGTSDHGTAQARGMAGLRPRRGLDLQLRRR